MMAATLANDGIIAHVSVVDPHYVRDVLSVMNSCGMYNYAGHWSYEVCMPAKSGVSGCIMALSSPAKFGYRRLKFTPPLMQANAGIKVCQDISNEFELHAFNNRTMCAALSAACTGAIAFTRAACARPRSATARREGSRAP